MSIQTETVTPADPYRTMSYDVAAGDLRRDRVLVVHRDREAPLLRDAAVHGDPHREHILVGVAAAALLPDEDKVGAVESDLEGGVKLVDLAEVDMSTCFLDKTLAAPLLISCMTGGTEEAALINRNLAIAAERVGVALGLGSQRKAIEDPETRDTFQVRDVAPNVPLLGNLGAVQFNYGYSIEQCREAVSMIDADALVLHLNPLQEAIQPETDAPLAVDEQDATDSALLYLTVGAKANTKSVRPLLASTYEDGDLLELLSLDLAVRDELRPIT